MGEEAPDGYLRVEDLKGDLNDDMLLQSSANRELDGKFVVAGQGRVDESMAMKDTMSMIVM